MFSTFDSLVFVFARFHGISKCPKTLQCLPLSLPPLYGVFSGSNGCTWHLTWLAFVDDEIQLFNVGKNISPWCYLPRIEEAGPHPPKWPNPAGVPLDTDLRQQWNFELRISQRAANSTQRVACSQMCTRNRCWGSSFFFILISQHCPHGLWSPASLPFIWSAKKEMKTKYIIS